MLVLFGFVFLALVTGFWSNMLPVPMTVWETGGSGWRSLFVLLLLVLYIVIQKRFVAKIRARLNPPKIPTPFSAETRASAKLRCQCSPTCPKAATAPHLAPERFISSARPMSSATSIRNHSKPSVAWKAERRTRLKAPIPRQAAAFNVFSRELTVRSELLPRVDFTRYNG